MRERAELELITQSRKGDHSKHWGVILAGGDGTRLRELSYRVSGDRRPKQFCSFFGSKSLLMHTRQRISSLIAESNTLFSLNRAHEVHYRRQLSDVPSHRKLVQPSNRGTAPAIAWAVLEVLQQDSDAIVAFFPSDHHYLDPSIFCATVDRGLRLATAYRDRVLIVGAPPSYPEVEYGWIQPARTLVDSSLGALQFVSAFWEKPSLSDAHLLLESGCLWNTFVTIGAVDAFVQLFARAAPRLLHAIGSGFSEEGLDPVYAQLEPLDFSRDILASVPQQLLVLRDGLSGWTDFGSPQRAMDVLKAMFEQQPGLTNLTVA
jgi:mannose-1-phosphate guanylyltransferase